MANVVRQSAAAGEIHVNASFRFHVISPYGRPKGTNNMSRQSHHFPRGTLLSSSSFPYRIEKATFRREGTTKYIQSTAQRTGKNYNVPRKRRRIHRTPTYVRDRKAIRSSREAKKEQCGSVCAVTGTVLPGNSSIEQAGKHTVYRRQGTESPTAVGWCNCKWQQRKWRRR